MANPDELITSSNFLTKEYSCNKWIAQSTVIPKQMIVTRINEKSKLICRKTHNKINDNKGITLTNTAIDAILTV